MYDGRPNAELFLATGCVEDQNSSDCLSMRAELVKADRLYSSKKSVVESAGFSVSEVSLILRWFMLSSVEERHPSLLDSKHSHRNCCV